jgi:MHS family shikimate/dehydroshikimate transporter-like MFS transporter
MSAALVDATARTTTPWRAAAASTIGSVLEYYDFFVYGPMAALVFSLIFFPDSSPAVGTLLALSTYAVGFVARPLGGIVIGHLGDKVGRKRMLVFTFLLTGSVTVAIGLLPTHAQIGLWAPLLLVSLRFLQGIGIGGEWGGAALLTVEHAPKGRRGFFGSLVQAGAPVGVILSSGTVAILTATLTREELLAWGWRIPFLASIVLVVVGLVIRLGVAESPEFSDVQEHGEQSGAPALEAVRRYPRQILATIGIHLGDTTLGFMQGIFVLGFATGVLKLDPTTVLLANITGSVAALLITPFMGHLGDRVGRQRVLALGAGALALWGFPMFWLINTRSVPALFVAMVVGSLIVGTLFSQQATFFAELYEPRVRYSAVSIGFQVATVIGGGFGPLIAQALQNSANGSTVPVSVYVVVVGLIGVVCALAAKPRPTHRTI